MKSPILRKLVYSNYVDLFGAALILGVCIWRNFHGTYYSGGEMEFGIPLSELTTKISQGSYPLGIMSTLGAVFSMLATRFTGKQKNSGNMIGIATTVNSGTNDFLFGNHSAIITYPITFISHSLAALNWHKGEKIKQRDSRYYLIVGIGMLVGFGLVYLGAYLFGGKTEHSFLIIVSITFGLSAGATFANIFKYEETWFSWSIYNVVQLIKNSMLMNLANVVKYIFYLFNAAITLFDWKLNGDKEKT